MKIVWLLLLSKLKLLDPTWRCSKANTVVTSSDHKELQRQPKVSDCGSSSCIAQTDSDSPYLLLLQSMKEHGRVTGPPPPSHLPHKFPVWKNKALVVTLKLFLNHVLKHFVPEKLAFTCTSSLILRFCPAGSRRSLMTCMKIAKFMAFIHQTIILIHSDGLVIQ